MNIPPIALVVVILIFGFLTGSTVFFYNKSQGESSVTKSNSSFSGEIPESVDANTPDKVDELTKPAEPKGRISYPANVYTVAPKETLFAIGAKFGMSWELIVRANGITDPNSIQAGTALVVPKYNRNTDYYRINFVPNEEKATQVNIELREVDNSDLFDPIKVAKSTAVPYWGIADSDEFTLLERNDQAGQAVVLAVKGETKNLIGLYQPKVKGDKGFWTILYIEHRND